MATLNGTVTQVSILDGGATSTVKLALVQFTATGTYDQSATAPIELLAVPTSIQNSVRNGKTVTMLDCGSGPAALIGTDDYVASSTVVNGANLEFDLYKASTNTEHANGALGTFNRPGSVIVCYIES